MAQYDYGAAPPTYSAPQYVAGVAGAAALVGYFDPARSTVQLRGPGTERVELVFLAGGRAALFPRHPAAQQVAAGPPAATCCAAGRGLRGWRWSGPATAYNRNRVVPKLAHCRLAPRPTLCTAPGLAIWHDPAVNCLLVKWRGPHDKPAKEAGGRAIIQQLRQTASTRRLVDSSQGLDTWAAAGYWLGHAYKRALFATGLRVAAWVLPRYVRAQAAANQVLHYLYESLNKPGHTLRFNPFQDVEAAHAWLLGVS